MIDLADDEGAVFQNVQEVVLGVRVGLVNLVREDAAIFGEKGAADGAQKRR